MLIFHLINHNVVFSGMALVNGDLRESREVSKIMILICLVGVNTLKDPLDLLIFAFGDTHDGCHSPEIWMYHVVCSS